MTAGIHSFTESGKMRRATLTEVSEWVSRAWNSVPVTVITNGFRKAGISSDDPVENDNSSDEDDNETSCCFLIVIVRMKTLTDFSIF